MKLTLPDRDHSVLIVVDIQERLLNALSEQVRDSVIARSGVLIDAARILGIPIVASEQYVKGLGPTALTIRDRLPPSVMPTEKTVFSCARSPEFRAALDATHRKQGIICGIETHVCVLQTALDLGDAGYDVSVAADAVGSRRDSDRDRALALMERAGVLVGTTETFVFRWLERAGTPEFKQIAQLLK
jgi:nicotinamidase-related amidase